ncbi:MAG: hypothetical protein LBP42_03225 [Treponema sp.]|nr:hypothetical protein [Treponema sp.]
MKFLGESAFSALYLVTAIILGVLTLRNARGRKEHLLFGATILVLGGGDAFHLVPRIFPPTAAGLHDRALGFGTLVTSITMTVFYVMLYHVGRNRYRTKSAVPTAAVYTLAVLRVGLCLFPQNNWFSPEASWEWGIFRNIPFVFLGALVTAFFYIKAKEQRDRPFRFMWLAITLSFVFYLPVVLFAGSYPLFGLFMIPKTLMYIWIIWMGYAQSNPSKASFS